MKEKENTVPTSRKKKLVYSVIVAVCALLLIAATVLTVYFVSENRTDVLQEAPPAEEPGDPADGPGEPSGGEPDDPTGGEKLAYVFPIEGAEYTVEYNDVYRNSTLDKWYYHKGVDYTAEEGADVRVIADGKVKKIDLNQRLGNLITVEHADGVESLYRFVEPVSGLKEGDAVKQGQVIAHVAAAYGTESKDGAHLHFEMTLSGKSVDPDKYLDTTLEEK